MSFVAATAVQMPKPVLGYFPATFRERGVAVPFTTPQLVGTRVRPGDRVPLEILAPNPSGGRGIYILPWSDIQGLCQPTLHDLRLIEVVAQRGAVTPGAIRASALDVAGEGFAGREATEAARLAAAASQRALLETNFDILLALLRQAEGPANAQAPDQETPTALQRRAQAAVARIAPEIGLTTSDVARLLEEIAALYTPLGTSSNRVRAPIPLLVDRLAQTKQEAMDHWRTRPDDGGPEAGIIAMVADLTLTCVAATMADAQSLLTDPRGLLVQWKTDPISLAERVGRSEWLVDGWDRIVALWQSQPDPARRSSVLGEILLMLPVIPKEASGWVSARFAMQEDLLRHRRKIVLFEDWRTGVTLQDIVARNEDLISETVAPLIFRSNKRKSKT